jgi:hypothetical protein
MQLFKSKKTFLKKLITASSILLTPAVLFAKRQENNIEKNNNLPPEESNEVHPAGWDTEALIKEFTGMNEGVKEYLKAIYKDDKLADSVTKNALIQYKALVIELPDVGGLKNPDSKFLNIAAWYLAYYRAMKPFGKTAEDVGKMIYQLNKIDLKHYPEKKAEFACNAFFSEKGRNDLKNWCEWTQKKEYPANWIAEYIPGDEEEFDFGYNYTHCGVCMYLYAYNARELAPFVCTNDFIKSEKLDTGLERTKTLAMGDNVCNFRFKKGRKVKQNWDTEIEKIREHIKSGKLYQP